MKRSNTRKSAEFVHKVFLCSARDEKIGEADVVLNRDVAYETYAAIKNFKFSQFGPGGMVILEPRNRETHEIFLRWRPDVQFTIYGWVMEQRRLTGKRWFKILGVKEIGEMQREVVLTVRLVEASEEAAPAQQVVEQDGIVVRKPAGISL